MNAILGKLWSWFDGKKTVLGWLGTQIPLLGQPTIFGAMSSAWDAWVIAIASHNYVGVVGPTAYLAAQILLAVGVAHKVIKDQKAATWAKE